MTKKGFAQSCFLFAPGNEHESLTLEVFGATQSKDNPLKPPLGPIVKLSYPTVKLLFSAAVCFAVGCGPSSTLLIHIGKNDLKYCQVNENTDICIRQLKSRGYIQANQLTPEERASLGVVLPY